MAYLSFWARDGVVVFFLRWSVAVGLCRVHVFVRLLWTPMNVGPYKRIPVDYGSE